MRSSTRSTSFLKSQSTVQQQQIPGVCIIIPCLYRANLFSRQNVIISLNPFFFFFFSFLISRRRQATATFRHLVHCRVAQRVVHSFVAAPPSALIELNTILSILTSFSLKKKILKILSTVQKGPWRTFPSPLTPKKNRKNRPFDEGGRRRKNSGRRIFSTDAAAAADYFHPYVFIIMIIII